MQTNTNTNTKTCSKCKLEKTLDQYSNPSKERRCRECVKEAKNSENKRAPLIDIDITDINSTEWQGGKYSGTIFERSKGTGPSNVFTVRVGSSSSVTKVEKTFRFTDETKNIVYNEANNWKKEHSDKLNLTSNKYKIVHENNIPKYLIVQLSQNYCTLVDYDQLDFIKNNLFFVSYSGTKTSKKYCSLINNEHRNKPIHGIIANNIIENNVVDHLNGYPLDNRKENLKIATIKENNLNRTTVIKNKSVIKKKIKKISNDEYLAYIKYTLDPLESPMQFSYIKEFFNNEDECNIYIQAKKKELNNKYSVIKRFFNEKINISNRQTLSTEFETIMKTHAGGFKWQDIDMVDNVNIDDTINKQVADNLNEMSVITKKKKPLYELFKSLYPDFQITDDYLIGGNEIKNIEYNNITYKYCGHCNTWLEKATSFYTSKDKINGWCKKCKYTVSNLSRQKKKQENKEVKNDNDFDFIEDNDDINFIEDDDINFIEDEDDDNNDIDFIEDDDNNTNMKNETIKKLYNIVNEKKGFVLTKDFKDSSDTIELKCNIGHTWTTRIKKILYGSWCHTCGLNVEDNVKVKISNKLKEYLQTDEGKQNKKLAHEKRSLTMTKIKENKMATITEKKCSGYCNTIKNINNFCKKSASADGYQSWCKECTNNKKKELRLK